MLAPGTWLQSRTWPEKMAWICCWFRAPIRLAGLVTTHSASRAIRLNTMPPGSPGCGSRDEFPMVTRPWETSAIPMLDPPWSRRNRTEPGNARRYPRASLAASGATVVDPLMVMVGLAEAPAGTAAAAAAGGGAAGEDVAVLPVRLR